MTEAVPDYAFPHVAANESRRLQLFERRLDPLTIRRIGQLGLTPGVRCLEVGGGRGSIARWLCRFVGPDGRVTVTDLQTDLLSALSIPNLTVLRHDVRTDDFPVGSFDFVHARAVLMHVDQRMAILNRMVSWLAPGGWLLIEEPDFGLWESDLDPRRRGPPTRIFSVADSPTSAPGGAPSTTWTSAIATTTDCPAAANSQPRASA